MFPCIQSLFVWPVSPFRLNSTIPEKTSLSEVEWKPLNRFQFAWPPLVVIKCLPITKSNTCRIYIWKNPLICYKDHASSFNHHILTQTIPRHSTFSSRCLSSYTNGNRSRTTAKQSDLFYLPRINDEIFALGWVTGAKGKWGYSTYNAPAKLKVISGPFQCCWLVNDWQLLELE